MKKLGISLIAVMVGLPTMANAADITAASKVNIATNRDVATTSFVGGAYNALVDEVNTNRTAINTLNGDATTAGSVAKAVADGVAGKQDTIDSTHKLDADLVDDTNSTHKFVAASDITNWNAKQEQLTNGTDNLSSTVATAVRATGSATDTTLVTEKAVRDAVDSAITAATYDDTALSGRVGSLETAVGDANSGLTKGVADNASAISALETAVGDANSGLTKAVADNTSAISALNTSVGALETAVGDNSSGLVKDVNELKTTVGDNTAGLVKDVNDLDSRIDSLESANETAKGFNVYGSWANPSTPTGSVTVTSENLASNN